MKTPLRFQVTEYDCGTISLLNAFSYLFERENIPVELVRAIHLYTLDCADENGVVGGKGTSKEAIKKLTRWITKFTSEKDFNVKCELLTGSDVTLEKITNCINSGGCIFFRCKQEVDHYVIGTKITKKYIYIFDPYYLDKKYYNNDKQVKIVFNKPFTHNRIVGLKRLFKESKQDFSLGIEENRECLLINRK